MTESSYDHKQQIEKIVNTDDSFNMLQLVNIVWQEIEKHPTVVRILPDLQKILQNNYKKLAVSILRNAFLIELVKIPKIETTKFRVRWCDQLNGDPRWCSFEECFQILEDLLINLINWFQTPTHAESLELSFSYGLIPYEAPIDYQVRFTKNGRLHERGNLVWFYDDLILRTLKLRKYLLDKETSSDSKFFRQVLTDKIKVKTYLTDRVLTGKHKTNREKRWETHPSSVHFAERRTCMAIEYALVTQICSFAGFDRLAIEKLQTANILPQSLPTALCPITGDELSYELFRDELLNPTHGKSNFQVGHLNPLKLGENSQLNGHTAENISWISADGNRIQGSLSLSDVRILIKRIADNYTKHKWWPQK